MKHYSPLALSLRAAACVALLFLGACAGRNGAGMGGGSTATNDVITASDESDATKRARIRYELAMGYFEEGKTTIALDEVKQVLQLLPTSVDAWVLRGLIYMRLEQKALAEESFRRAQALQPNNGLVAHNYGWLLCQQKRYPESVVQFQKAVASGYVDASRSYMNMGICQTEAGQKAQAEESFRRSVEMEPTNPISGYNLALIMYQRANYEQARFYIRRINNGDYANAQTLWLGVRVEHALHNRVAEQQLAMQLRSRFAASNEVSLLDRGAYDEQ